MHTEFSTHTSQEVGRQHLWKSLSFVDYYYDDKMPGLHSFGKNRADLRVDKREIRIHRNAYFPPLYWMVSTVAILLSTINIEWTTKHLFEYISKHREARDNQQLSGFASCSD